MNDALMLAIRGKYETEKQRVKSEADLTLKDIYGKIISKKDEACTEVA